MVVQVFVTMKILLGKLRLVAAVSASGGDSIEEVHSPILLGENLKSSLY
jgi:hypothetical protein